MPRVLRLVLLLFLSVFFCGLYAQTSVWRDVYKVKKKDTIYGIARSYSISTEELMDANPEMKAAGYTLKKGTMVFIPFSGEAGPAETTAANASAKTEKKVKIGVMLPLHNADGDGKRMTEYYRGMLIACDSLREEGIDTDVYAWNVDIDADIRTTLADKNAKGLDVIFGPLYTKQVKPLADFCKDNGIKLVIPFSITADDVQTNDHVYQVYQNGGRLNARAVAFFFDRFKDCNPVFIDCNDTTSQKGAFTSALRKELERRGISYQITNLRSPEDKFKMVFADNKRNVVILNTGRSPELNLAFRKLNELRISFPDTGISMYGYTEWLLYESVYRELYHRYDVYIPGTFYYYKGLSRVAAFERNYRKWFGEGMQEQYIPRFALTGYDHAQFFIRGLYYNGSSFQGTAGESAYKPMQTPLVFQKTEQGQGMQNKAFQLVHYKVDGVIETIGY